MKERIRLPNLKAKLVTTIDSRLTRIGSERRELSLAGPERKHIGLGNSIFDNNLHWFDQVPPHSQNDQIPRHLRQNPPVTDRLGADTQLRKSDSPALEDGLLVLGDGRRKSCI